MDPEESFDYRDEDDFARLVAFAENSPGESVEEGFDFWDEVPIEDREAVREIWNEIQEEVDEDPDTTWMMAE